MRQRTGRKSRAIRVAVVDPNQADAHWVHLLLEEAQLPVELIHYPTGVSALEEWIKAGHAAIDLIVVADVLPMLTLREFIDAAKTFYPPIVIAVAAERTGLPALQLRLQRDDVECYPKPLSANDLGQIMHRVRRTLTIRPQAHGGRDESTERLGEQSGCSITV